LKQPEKREMMKIEKNMYSLLQYFRIAIYFKILFLLYFGNLKEKKLLINLWISCLWHFILLGPIFAFWEERGWMGEGELKQK